MIGGYPIGGTAIGGVGTTIGVAVVSATPAVPLYLLVDNDGRSLAVDSEGRPMHDFWIKRGDTSPDITGQLLDGNLAVVPITGSTVRFKAKDRETGAVFLDAVAAVSDGPLGLVRYTWQAADTEDQAELIAEWEVTLADGTVRTWPNPQSLSVHIVGDVS